MTGVAGYNVRGHRDGGVGNRVGNGGVDEAPVGAQKSAGRASPCGGARAKSCGERLGQAGVPQVLYQRNTKAPPSHPTPPPRDSRGLGDRRLLCPRRSSSVDQRLGHWTRPNCVEGPGQLQAGEVRGGRCTRLQGWILRAHPLRLRPAFLPGYAVGSLWLGDGRGTDVALLHMGVAYEAV